MHLAFFNIFPLSAAGSDFLFRLVAFLSLPPCPFIYNPPFRSLMGSGVCLAFLSANQQTFSLPGAALATDLRQEVDV